MDVFVWSLLVNIEVLYALVLSKDRCSLVMPAPSAAQRGLCRGCGRISSSRGGVRIICIKFVYDIINVHVICIYVFVYIFHVKIFVTFRNGITIFQSVIWKVIMIRLYLLEITINYFFGITIKYWTFFLIEITINYQNNVIITIVVFICIIDIFNINVIIIWYVFH